MNKNIENYECDGQLSINDLAQNKSRCIVTVLNADGSIVTQEVKRNCTIEYVPERDIWLCKKPQ